MKFIKHILNDIDIDILQEKAKNWQMKDILNWRHCFSKFVAINLCIILTQNLQITEVPVKFVENKIVSCFSLQYSGWLENSWVTFYFGNKLIF